MRSAYIYALSASVFWGAGFIGSRYSLESFDAMWITHFRFLIATILLLPFLFKAKKNDLSKELVFQSALCGLFLLLMMFLQIKGVSLTTVAKSSFLTITYCFFTPLLSFLLFKEKISLYFFFCTVASLTGILFLCDFKVTSLNMGDGLIILSAIFTSFQLIYLSKYLQNVSNLMLFNFFQMLSVTIFSLIYAVAFEGFDRISLISINKDMNALLGIIFMGVFSTTIAFIFQVKCQKFLKGHIAGLIYLVESPIAAVLAYYLFNEQLNLFGLIGCFIIVTATILVLVEENKKIIAS